MNIKEEIRALRFKHLRWALQQTQGKQREAARLLGVTPTLFDRWMRELGLQEFAVKLRKEQTNWVWPNKPRRL